MTNYLNLLLKPAVKLLEKAVKGGVPHTKNDTEG